MPKRFVGTPVLKLPPGLRFSKWDQKGEPRVLPGIVSLDEKGGLVGEGVIYHQFQQDLEVASGSSTDPEKVAGSLKGERL